MPDAETHDAFLDGRLMLLQPRSGYRAGLDAVLLAATVTQLPAGARILDLGAGVGAVGLAVAVRHREARVVLVEKQAALAELCARNIERNDLGARARAVIADLEAPAAHLTTAGVEAETFDIVLANPPYQTEGEGRSPPDPVKAGAHVMPAGGIERWARAAARLVRPNGTVAFIHRADALPELLTALGARFGALTLLPIHARAGAPASRVVVAGRKGSRAPLRLLSGLVLHEGVGHGFTPHLQAILRQGAGVDLWAADAPTLVLLRPAS